MRAHCSAVEQYVKSNYTLLRVGKRSGENIKLYDETYFAVARRVRFTVNIMP